MRYFAALLLVAGALVPVASATAAPRVIKPTTLTIHVGKHGVAGGPKKFTVRKGTHVVLIVYSAIGKVVHLHGYDIERPIRDQTIPVRIAFVARVTGQFEIELHLTSSLDLRIGMLTVR